MKDTIDPDESRRYKAIYWNSHEGLHDSRIAVAYSPDGRSWTVEKELLSISQMTERQLGDVIFLSSDKTTSLYYLDTRTRAMQEPPVNSKHPTVQGWGPAHFPHDRWRMSKRRVSSSVSYDVLNWPVLQDAIVPEDDLDNLDDEFYGLARFRIGDLWLGLMPIFHRTHNTQDLHLLFSRDSFSWHRVDRTKPFIANAPEGAWDCYMSEMGAAPIFLEDEIRFYYGGANLHHDWWQFGESEGMEHPEARSGWGGGETALGLATLRPEGFASIDATFREGILGTHPFVSDGSRLVVNAACGTKGFLEIELADAGDNVVPGYARSACDTFAGDSTSHVVTWGGKAALPQEIMAKGAKLRFFSRHCSLYSFKIA